MTDPDPDPAPEPTTHGRPTAESQPVGAAPSNARGGCLGGSAAMLALLVAILATAWTWLG